MSLLNVLDALLTVCDMQILSANDLIDGNQLLSDFDINYIHEELTSRA